MLFATGLLCSLDDFVRDDGAIGFDDFVFFNFARDDLFNLVLEPKSDFGDVDSGNGGLNDLIPIRRKN